MNTDQNDHTMIDLGQRSRVYPEIRLGGKSSKRDRTNWYILNYVLVVCTALVIMMLYIVRINSECCTLVIDLWGILPIYYMEGTPESV